MFCNYLPKVFFFFCFILLLMFCAICQLAFAENSVKKPSKTIALLLPNNTNIKLNGVLSGGTEKTFESFTFPKLNCVGDVLVLFAQAKNITGPKACDIVESYFELTGDSNLDKAFVEGSSDSVWTKKIVFKNDENKCRENPTTVVDNKKIYVFFNSTDSGGNNFENEFIGGEVKDKAGSITWEGPSKKLKDQLEISPEDAMNGISVVNGGPGIVVKDSFVVPVLYTKNTDKFVSVITRKSDTEGKWNLVVNERSPKGMHPAVVEWGDKLIMMIFSSDGYRKVYEYSKTQKTWTEAVGSLSGVWGNTNERTPKEYGGQWGFIMADVGEKEKEKKVMLVTQPVWIENEKYKLHLWMTDYKRIYDAGEISIEVGQNISSTLLHAKDNLFVAYEKWDNGNSTIYAVELKEQLGNVKKMFDKWTEQDNFLSRSCFADDLTLKSDDTCTNNKISTDGLVGFLSGSYSDGKWADEYWCVNATVTERNKVQNVTKGLKFNGAAATWPVSQQGQNQPYHFVNHVFTLVATVKIGSEATENKNSILGIGLGGIGGDKKCIGLWCSGGKWAVRDGKSTADTTVTEKTCVKEGIYQVAVILNNNKFSVYIGKKKEGISPDRIIDAQQPLSITHFYFGADNNEEVESHVTVTNVLLYNRPFGESDIKKLKEYVTSVKNTTRPDEHTTTTAQGGEQTPTRPTDLDERKEEKKAPSPSRTEDGGLGGGVRVFSLLLAVLCVSAPLLHL